MKGLEQRFFEEHGPALRRLARSYEADPAHAEDLLQEILFAVWRALPGFRGECSERTFVFRIAHNRAIAHCCKRAAARTSEVELPDLVDHRPDPERSALQAERGELLRAAVRRLPIPLREVLTLSLEGFDAKEVAAVAGISEGNAAVRLHRARRMLKEWLDESKGNANE